MLDFDDIDLDNADEINEQIAERAAAIDRMESEMKQLAYTFVARARARDSDRHTP